jgi:hypothetical protein
LNHSSTAWPRRLRRLKPKASGTFACILMMRLT